MFISEHISKRKIHIEQILSSHVHRLPVTDKKEKESVNILVKSNVIVDLQQINVFIIYNLKFRYFQTRIFANKGKSFQYSYTM